VGRTLLSDAFDVDLDVDFDFAEGRAGGAQHRGRAALQRRVKPSYPAAASTPILRQPRKAGQWVSSGTVAISPVNNLMPSLNHISDGTQELG